MVQAVPHWLEDLEADFDCRKALAEAAEVMFE